MLLICPHQHQVIYTITYSYGVNCTLDFDVEILGLPTVDLGNDTAICQGNPITFEPSTTAANSFYGLMIQKNQITVVGVLKLMIQ